MTLSERKERKKDSIAQFYTFENQVPVGIFNGECVVDFKEIKAYLAGE